MHKLKHILYFADGEFGPTSAFRRAVALAERHGARLTLMDVTIESGFSAELVQQFGLGDDVQQSEQLTGGNLHLLRGEPASQVLACAEALGSDLLVLGTLSRPREPGLFIGTTAEDLLQGAKTSVLALKPDGFVTPVQ